MIKTLTLDGLTSVTIKQSAYDMARFCWLYNHSESDIFASCVNSECTENADNVLRIPAGEPRMLDTESYETLYLNGSGTVELITSAYSVCPFGEGKKGGGASLSGSAAYTINNAVDYPLMGLNLYGKSTQNGTPTPESPVEIVSVGDSGFDIISKNDTHFNLLSVRDSGGEIITKQPVSIAAKVGNKVTFTVAASGTGLKYQWKFSRDNGKTWDNGYGGGTAVTPAYSFNASKTDNGTIYKCVITDANGVKTETNIATLYVVSDDCEVKTASIATDALPLCGIPVESGGNYTDSNGQQWICDELIYNADGTGKIIKNTRIYTFTGNENFALRGNNNAYVYSIYNLLIYKHHSGIRSVSDKYMCSGTAFDSTTAIETLKIGENQFFYNEGYPTDNYVYFGSSCTTPEDFKSEITGSRIIYPLAAPLEIELTAAEMTAFRQLQTFNGVTSISNNVGAEMSVEYCTNKMLSEYVLPITMGLQKQIDELQAAILSLGSNV